MTFQRTPETGMDQKSLRGPYKAGRISAAQATVAHVLRSETSPIIIISRFGPSRSSDCLLIVGPAAHWWDICSM